MPTSSPPQGPAPCGRAGRLAVGARSGLGMSTAHTAGTRAPIASWCRRGRSRAGRPDALDERPIETKRLPGFRIDRTEITRAMYARCVAARRCKAPPIDLTEEPDLPVTHVSWHDARAYCAFARGRLPTEDEWEKAARGTDAREFPWGAAPDCSRANWGNFDGEGPCAGSNPGRPVPVGRYPSGASPYGILDLGGNVWEWVASPYDDEPGRRSGARRVLLQLLRGAAGSQP